MCQAQPKPFSRLFQCSFAFTLHEKRKAQVKKLTAFEMTIKSSWFSVGF